MMALDAIVATAVNVGQEIVVVYREAAETNEFLIYFIIQY